MTTLLRQESEVSMFSGPGPNPLKNLSNKFTGVDVPDPITFVVGEEWCNRPNLYPRQATAIKVIFLRNDLLTDYDHEVIDEWENQYRLTNGNEGLAPGVRDKMRALAVCPCGHSAVRHAKHRDACAECGLCKQYGGHKWFREVLLVMGRRAGKGHLTALCMAYVLWNYMSHGDPQRHYGVDRDKKLVALIFAGKRDQAKSTVFADLVNVITGSHCFLEWLSQDHAEKLSIYAPNDTVRRRKQAERGVRSDRDQATFVIQPRESTVMAGRGPTSFMQAYDEMAHVVASGANRSAEEVYDAAKPSLDQFGKDAFIMEPSSPWQMLGQFYDNWLRANEVDEDGEFVYPDMLSLQLASWDIYKDWQETVGGQMPLFPEGFAGDLHEYIDEDGNQVAKHPTFYPLRGAIQVFDEQMEREKRAKPDTFKVEREAKWATALDAYLNEQKVAQIFQPWADRPEKYGPPEILKVRRGIMVHTYKGHADPSKVNDKFGIAVAHAEYDAEGMPHCVFDLLHHFDPADFPDHIVDYGEVDDWLWENVIQAFMPEEFTFDQYNSTSSIQRLQKKIREHPMPKRVQVFEKTVTRAQDWEVKENAKAAINLDLVHCFSTDDPHAARAELELRFLQLVNGRVDHPSSGPVQSKDIADCMMECIDVLIGEQVNNFLHKELSNFRPGAALQGGIDPFQAMRQGGASREDDEILGAMKAFSAGRGRQEYTPSLNRGRGRRSGR